MIKFVNFEIQELFESSESYELLVNFILKISKKNCQTATRG